MAVQSAGTRLTGTSHRLLLRNLGRIHAMGLSHTGGFSPLPHTLIQGMFGNASACVLRTYIYTCISRLLLPWHSPFRALPYVFAYIEVDHYFSSQT